MNKNYKKYSSIKEEGRKKEVKISIKTDLFHQEENNNKLKQTDDDCIDLLCLICPFCTLDITADSLEHEECIRQSEVDQCDVFDIRNWNCANDCCQQNWDKDV